MICIPTKKKIIEKWRSTFNRFDDTLEIYFVDPAIVRMNDNDNSKDT